MSKHANPKTTKVPKSPKAATKPAAKNPATAKAPKKMSALDAAAQVLAGAKEPMTSKALIEAMAAKGLWKSPGGQTPHATLYATMTREISQAGKDSRFKKVDRGQFALNK